MLIARGRSGRKGNEHPQGSRRMELDAICESVKQRSGIVGDGLATMLPARHSC